MKIGLDTDERWPVYSFKTDRPDLYEQVEVPEELVERAARVTAEYNALQDELAHVWRKQLEA